MKKILIIGVTSNVGYRFLNFSQNKFEVFGVCRKWPLGHRANIFECSDLVENQDALPQLMANIQPDVVINCLGIGDIDYCELHHDDAKKMNFDFIVRVVSHCNQFGTKGVFFSSSVIYDGDEYPFSEKATPKPNNYYAKLKVMADDFVRANASNYLLLRPNTIYGIKQPFQRNNFLNFILEKLRRNEDLLLTNDAFCNILFLDDLIGILFKLIEQIEISEYNVSGNEVFSRYQLGMKICEKMNFNSGLIKVCSSSYFKSLAVRSKHMILDNSALKTKINFPLHNFEEALALILKEQTQASV